VQDTTVVTVTLLIISVIGFVYIIQNDAALERYTQRVKRKDVLFWNDHYFVYGLNAAVIDGLRDHEDVRIYEAPIGPPHKRWGPTPNRGGQRGYDTF
jgi:hypothetical protein